jgi:hypothetical protein
MLCNGLDMVTRHEADISRLSQERHIARLARCSGPIDGFLLHFALCARVAAHCRTARRNGTSRRYVIPRKRLQTVIASDR